MKTQQDRNLIALNLKRLDRLGVYRVSTIQVFLCLASSPASGATAAEISKWTGIESNSCIHQCKQMRDLGLTSDFKASRGDRRERLWVLTPKAQDLISGRA